MGNVILRRNKDFMIIFRALKIYVNDKFVDYFEPGESSKIIEINDSSAKISVKVDWCTSNTQEINLDGKDKSLRISSQIHNGLFILIFGSFIGGSLLKIFGLIGPYAYMALTSPIAIIVGWQIFGRKNYLRLSKE